MKNFIRLVRWLYAVTFTLALPFIFLRLLWKSRKNPDYRQRWAERLGLFSAPQKKGGLWLHAVSVGESIAAVTIIKAFQKQFPHMPVTVTTTTPTGSKQISTQLGDTVFHIYFPYDLPWTFNAFLNRIQPTLVVIMETELWPNCLQVLKQRRIPILIANARLSPGSMKGYKRIKALTQEMLSSVTMVAAQSKMDGDRFLELGLPQTSLNVIGNVKYDMLLPEGIEAKGQSLRNQWGNTRPVLIAASTHAGEEEQVLKAFSILRENFKDLLLILVPRHRERFPLAAELLQAQGFHYVTRSSGETPNENTAVFLGDTMGEMLLLYAASDIAFVGGSLVPIGGHNTLEPAMLGVACIVGPHTHNFIEITQKLKTAGALVQIQNSETLAAAVNDWLKNSDKRLLAGNQGRQVVAENRGAVQKMMQLMINYFPS